MSIDRVLRQCFLTYGYAKGFYNTTEEGYSVLLEETRMNFDMTPEEYLRHKGLNIEIIII